MQKKFLKSLILILTLNLLIKPFWVLGIDRTVQNIVGAKDFGFYFVIFNFSFLFNIILDLGITNYNNRNIARNSHLLKHNFQRLVPVKIILGALYSIITFIIFLSIFGYEQRQFKILAFLCVNQFLLSFILYLRSNIAGLLLLTTESIMSVLDRILMIIICSFLLWSNIIKGSFKIEWFVYSQTIAYIITALIVSIIVIKKSKFERLIWDKKFSLKLLKKSAPYALLVLLMTFYNRIDPILIKKVLSESLGDQQAGIYASAFRLLDASNMIAYLFSILLLPMFSKMIKHNESVDKIVKLSTSILITGAIIVSLGSFFYNYDIISLLYTDHIAESAAVFKIIIFGFIPIASTYIFGTLLTANGNLKILNIIAGSGMILSIFLNLILIPKFMAVGSAYASISAQFITAVAQIIFVQYIFKFKINYKLLIKLFLFFIGVIAINIFSKQLSFDWKLNFTIMIATSLLLASLLKLFSVKSLLKIITKKEEE